MIWLFLTTIHTSKEILKGCVKKLSRELKSFKKDFKPLTRYLIVCLICLCTHANFSVIKSVFYKVSWMSPETKQNIIFMCDRLLG